MNHPDTTSQSSLAEVTEGLGEHGQVRATLLLDAERCKELQAMATALGVSDSEVFNVALSAVAWILRERSKGRLVASLDEETGEYVELELGNPTRAPTGAVMQ